MERRPVGWWGILIRAGVCGLLTAAAFPLAFGSLGGEPLLGPASECLAWIALVPLMCGLQGATFRRAFAGGALAGAVFFGVCLYWLAEAIATFGRLPQIASLFVLFLLVGFLALFWGMAFGLAAFLQRRLGLFEGWALPLIWTALEFLRNFLLSGFPWANLGTSQVRSLWLGQLGWLGGPYLVAALVVFTNGALFSLWQWWRGRRPLAKKTIALWAACMAAAAVLAAARLTGSWEEGEPLAVALIQGNLDERAGLRGSPAQRWVIQRMLQKSAEALAAGARLVVWPEGTLPDPLAVSVRSLAPSDLWPTSASAEKGELLVGAILRGFEAGEPHLYNSALLLDPSLQIKGRYDKEHLVPFGEYVPLGKNLPLQWFMPATVAFFSPGRSHHPLEAAAGRLGVLICYEAIFPEIARRTTADGAELLINITNDSWYGPTSAPYQHLEQSRMRAIENGRYLVRAANTGVSAVIDPAGRVLGRLPLGLVPSAGEAVGTDSLPPAGLLLGKVRLLGGRTPYQVLGDWFAWWCVIFCLGAMAYAFWPGRHRLHGPYKTFTPQAG